MNASILPGKRAATHEFILDHAYALARREGLEGLSIGALAQDVGMSKSGVFAHFGSREELQLAVLQAGQQRFLEQVKFPALLLPRGLARLRAIVGAWIDWIRAYPSGCVLLAAASEYDGREGPLHDKVAQQQAGWRRELVRTIGHAVENGELRQEAEPARIAFEIHALMLGLHHDAALFGFDEAQGHVRTAFERLLSSYRPEGGQEGTP